MPAVRSLAGEIPRLCWQGRTNSKGWLGARQTGQASSADRHQRCRCSWKHQRRDGRKLPDIPGPELRRGQGANQGARQNARIALRRGIPQEIVQIIPGQLVSRAAWTRPEILLVQPEETGTFGVIDGDDAAEGAWWGFGIYRNKKLLSNAWMCHGLSLIDPLYDRFASMIVAIIPAFASLAMDKVANGPFSETDYGNADTGAWEGGNQAQVCKHTFIG
ncbi:hypothetical protein VFPPC_16704 [Pochonia chlamydosporia 170]|uniref:Uncharacterized protein n=1 Tax=Pochonia chlamydosporia 170 TaxID=1380566 RepID=A0A179F724_METCM|nr:hypothetical protein VFPPC_16704 [Pochonia chlamydosporia 170]OAQ61110.1 hypothetical protein VFPPC_16704 [Pochonia chlamydosporia 170]